MITFRVGVVEVEGENKMVSLETTTKDGLFVQRIILAAGPAKEIANQLIEAAHEVSKPQIVRPFEKN